MKRKTIIAVAFAFCTAGLLSACKTSRRTAQHSHDLPVFFKVGHRGTRGLMPENTIPAMEKGIMVGANTIEFDVHITRDNKVVVYHDASFDPAYTTFPDGRDITKQERRKYIFYHLNYDEIRPFVIGEKYYPQFPQQQKMKTYAPLLSDMIDSVEAFTKANHLPAVNYLLEIKSSQKTDGIEQPVPEEFVKIMMPVLVARHLNGRLIIQSFDMRPLQVIHRQYPGIPLGFLTSDKQATVKENLDQLGFVPEFYNPEYHLVTPGLLEECHTKHIRVIPWTVEDTNDMQHLKDMGVDGIITDYPDRLKMIK